MTEAPVRGHLELLLLAVVAGGPAHGYAIIEALREKSGGAFDFPEGTVYPALHGLEEDGLLRSRWEEGAPRRRRVYSLTRRGRTELSRKTDQWRSLVRAVDVVLGATG